MVLSFPPVQQDDWEAYQRDRFKEDTDTRISSLAPPSSDSLTNPSRNATGGGGVEPLPSAEFTGAPDPRQTQSSFSDHADTQIASLTASPSAPAAQSYQPTSVGAGVPSAAWDVGRPPGAGTSSGDSIADALNVADEEGVDGRLFVGLLNQESDNQQFDAGGKVKTSPVGARGASQLMPDTARGLGVNPDDPLDNLRGGARYLKQMIDRFGGDVTKGLAAYNAGPGAVEQYGGVPPFKETQTYVDNIMSRLAKESIDTSDTSGMPGSFAPGPTEGLQRVGADIGKANAARDISQFGDPQLTAEEAYAACGPAAAVRFAQRFGRNPTLKEATDLARQVGWTPQQGMAGLQSEKALMDKLQIPTKLIVGAQWDQFAQEAQTGNPVTISTQGHYFTADGFDPSSGAFHVGRSGLDLKAGKEWMTPAEMVAVMGPVQGGLLADNPQIPAPSTADQDTNPSGWLDRSKQALTAGWDTASSAVAGAGQDAANAGSGAAQSVFVPSPLTKEMQPTPSDTLTNPTLQSAAPAQSPGPQQTVWDRLGTGIADLFKNAFSGPSTYAQTAEYIKQRSAGMTPEQVQAQAQQDVLDMVPQNPLEMAGAGLGEPTSGEQIDRRRTEFIEQNNPLRDVPVAGGVTTFLGQAATDPTNLLLFGPSATKAVASVAGDVAEAAGPLIRSRQAAQLDLGLITGGRKATQVEEALDSGLIIPGEAAPTGPQQIVGPRGELLSTVASREGPPAPGVGVVRSAAGAEVINEPSAAAKARMPNIAKMASDMPEVQATIQRVADENPQLIDAFRQGKISHQQLINDLAPRLGMTAEDFLKSRVGQAFNPEEMLALRASVVTNQARAVQLADDIFAKGGVDALNAEDKVRAIGQIVDAARLQAVGRGAASTAGRTLNQQKIIIDRTMAEAITGGNEKIAAQKALNAAKAKQAWAEKKLAELGETVAPKQPSARQEVLDAWKKIGQESKAAAAERDAPVLAAYDDAISAARSDLRATQNYLADTFDAEMTRLDKEASARMSKAGAAQGEGQVAWLKAQANAAQQEVNAVNNRALKAFDTEMRLRERQQAQAGKILDALGGRKVTDNMLRQFVALQRSGDQLAAAKFLKSMGNVSMWDRIGILRYASMLSSTATHLTNSLGNTIQLGLDVGLKPLSVAADVGISRLRGTERTRYMGEIPQQIRGMGEGLIAGLKDAKTTLIDGIDPRTASKLESVRPGFNSGNAAVDLAVEAPLRLLAAADNVFRGAARGGQIRALATRRGIQEGYTGEALARRVGEIASNLSDYPSLLEEAEQSAARVVLQESREELRGLASVSSGPAGFIRSIFLPFVKTPYNIAAQGLGMTPAGYAGALRSIAKGEGGEAADRVARATFGTAVMGFGGFLGMSGLLTGATPKDESAKSTLPPGWKPWSVRVPTANGATYVSYQNLGPVGVPLALSAVMTEAARQGQPIDPAKVVAGFGRFMVDQTFLQGLDAMVKAIEEPERYAENLSEGLVSPTIPYSALQRQVQRAIGMADRDPHGAADALLATSPFTAALVAPRTTPLGEPVQQGQTGVAAMVSPLRYDIERDTPVLKALRAADVGVPAVPKKLTVKGREIELTQAEQAQLKAARGQKINDLIGDLIARDPLTDLTPAEKKQLLQRAVQQATSKADDEMLTGMPDDQFYSRLKQPAPVPYVVGAR